MENPYTSKNFIVNNMTIEERLELKHSLLDKEINIILIDNYGLFTEHGFPVAIAAYWKRRNLDIPKKFKAKVIKVSPVVTINELPEI